MPTKPPLIPDFLYGTAWKEDRTAALTGLALQTGFRGIDTANQRRHYFEAGVGQGLAAAYRAGVVERADVFLQTKFTYQPGQDHRLPGGKRKIIYQGFSLLTANVEVLRHHLITGLAARAAATPAQVVFAFAHAVGMLPLTGTSSAEHMKQDLASRELTLPPDAVRAIESLAG